MLKIQATERRRMCNRHPNDDNCSCHKGVNIVVGVVLFFFFLSFPLPCLFSLLSDDQKVVGVSLVEADIAQLRYEVVYLDECQRNIKFTLKKAMKKLKRKHFSNSLVSVCACSHQHMA